MGTTIRANTSKKSKYWISRHRYYELKHFCLQYKEWEVLYLHLDGFAKGDYTRPPENQMIGDPTAHTSIEKCIYFAKLDMINRCIESSDLGLAQYLFAGVTEGRSYEYLKAKLDIPCSRDTYYDRYRKFFWLLDKERGVIRIITSSKFIEFQSN